MNPAISQAFDPYRHPFWRVVGIKPAGTEDRGIPTCDNYHLFTALYFRMFGGTVMERGLYLNFLTHCYVNYGLFTRFPGLKTDISQDEIFGIVSFAPKDAKADQGTCEFGERRWWCYNVEDPTQFKFDYFFARIGIFVAYLKMRARKPAYLWQLYWFIGFVMSAFTDKTETSGKQLAYLQIPVMSATWSGRLAIWIWRWKMRRTYPGGMRDVCKIYFPPGHPFTVYAPEDFE